LSSAICRQVTTLYETTPGKRRRESRQHPDISKKPGSVAGSAVAGTNHKGSSDLTGKFSVRKPTIIGWREHISLPELGIHALAVKIDTGARTSALHAEDQQFFERDGVEWVSFCVPLAGDLKTKRVEAPVIDDREIKNTSGKPERRIVIATTIRMETRSWRIETSLADRESMKFDMILGRTAIRRRGLLVDPGKSFLLPVQSCTEADKNERTKRKEV